MNDCRIFHGHLWYSSSCSKTISTVWLQTIQVLPVPIFCITKCKLFSSMAADSAVCSGQYFPTTPSPNKAKSYFTGSSASNVLSAAVSSNAVFQFICRLLIKPSFPATRPTCTSHGQINCDGFIFFQSPKSTPQLSLLTIHRRNIFSRLQAELRAGVAICFLVRCGAFSSSKK